MQVMKVKEVKEHEKLVIEGPEQRFKPDTFLL